MKIIKAAVSGQGRVGVVGHRSIDRTSDRPPAQPGYPTIYGNRGELPGTPSGGTNYTEKTGSLAPGNVAQRFAWGAGADPDEYYSDYGAMGSRQFNTRVH